MGLRLVLTGRTSSARFVGGIVLALPVTIKIIPLLPIAFVLFIQLAGFLRNDGGGNHWPRNSAGNWPLPRRAWGWDWCCSSSCSPPP